MNKKNFITIMLLMTFMAVTATAEAQLKYGIKAEVGLNKPTFTTKDFANNFKVENMNAFKVGPSIEFMMPIMGLGVDASLLYSNEKMNVQTINSSDGNVLDQIISVQTHHLELPVNLKYKIGIVSIAKAYLAAGPFIGVNLTNADFGNLPVVQQNIEQKKFQAGINLGFGAEVLDKLQLGFNYHMKMTDDYSVDQPEIKDLLNNNKGFWSFTAAVYF